MNKGKTNNHLQNWLLQDPKKCLLGRSKKLVCQLWKAPEFHEVHRSPACYLPEGGESVLIATTGDYYSSL